MQRCLFCSGDASGPNHRQYCDGRQGAIEAEPDPAPYTLPALDVRGMVHTDDPYTSVEAAESVVLHLSELQNQVTAAFREHGTLSDDRLERLPQFAGYAYSTVRKRRTELCQLGILVAVGDEINSRGRKMLVWAIRNVGR